MAPPRRSRHRPLTGEERRLWSEFARGITPLPGRALPDPAPDGASSGEGSSVAGRSLESSPARAGSSGREAAVRDAPGRTPVGRAAPEGAPPERPPPGLVALDRRTRTALRRGSARAEAVLDLHGMRQAEAHAALVAFLVRARGAGHGLVLVVTGKGGAGVGLGWRGDDPFAERGILRRSVPHWLRLPDLRALVLGFEEASTRHGGAGALYVRLRRRGVASS